MHVASGDVLRPRESWPPNGAQKIENGVESSDVSRPRERGEGDKDVLRVDPFSSVKVAIPHAIPRLCHVLRVIHLGSVKASRVRTTGSNEVARPVLQGVGEPKDAG